MSTERPNPHRRLVKRLRLIAAASGVAALAAFALPSTAGAEPVQTFSTSQLATADSAVLAADIAGTAWTVDEETGKVLVTVDSTVTQEEIAEIKESAGSLAGAIEVERTPARWRTTCRAVTPSTRVAGAARPASTPPGAARRSC